MRRVAILIGNATFDPDSGLIDLKYPVDDARDLSELLADKEIGCFDRIETKFNGSRDEILAAMDSIFDEERGSTIVFYYSGHGNVSDGGRLFLAASNTRRNRLRSTGLSFSEILEMKDDYGCGRFCAILDCCYAGLASETVKGTHDDQLRALAAGKGVFFLGAANATTGAREDETLGHGVLTAAILEGLRSGSADLDNDGLISGPNLFAWCRDFARERNYHRPIHVTRVEDDDLVIAFSKRKLPEETIQAARRKLVVLWEHQLAPREYLDRLRNYFSVSGSVLKPSPGTLEGDFLEFVEQRLEWSQFLVRQAEARASSSNEQVISKSTERRPAPLERHGDKATEGARSSPSQFSEDHAEAGPSLADAPPKDSNRKSRNATAILVGVFSVLIVAGAAVGGGTPMLLTAAVLVIILGGLVGMIWMLRGR